MELRLTIPTAAHHLNTIRPVALIPRQPERTTAFLFYFFFFLLFQSLTEDSIGMKKIRLDTVVRTTARCLRSNVPRETRLGDRVCDGVSPCRIRDIDRKVYFRDRIYTFRVRRLTGRRPSERVRGRTRCTTAAARPPREIAASDKPPAVARSTGAPRRRPSGSRL